MVTAGTVQISAKPMPALPRIGLDESRYAHDARKAEREGDHDAHEAAKVGMYVTLALDPHIGWDQKIRYFKHALRTHCNPPPVPDEATWSFYRELALLVKRYAGQEALRLASREDDFYAARLAMGQTREQIEDDAETFFMKLLGASDHCPDYFLEEDWEQLKLIRDQWV